MLRWYMMIRLWIHVWCCIVELVWGENWLKKLKNHGENNCCRQGGIRSEPAVAAQLLVSWQLLLPGSVAADQLTFSFYSRDYLGYQEWQTKQEIFNTFKRIFKWLVFCCSISWLDVSNNLWSNPTNQWWAHVREVVLDIHDGEEGVPADPAVVEVVHHGDQAQVGHPGDSLRHCHVHGTQHYCWHWYSKTNHLMSQRFEVSIKSLEIVHVESEQSCFC